MNSKTVQKTVFDYKLGYYQQAIALFEELEEMEGLAFCYLKIGNILSEQGNYNKALEAYKSGLKMAQQVGVEMISANCLLKMGLIFELRKQPTQALNCFHTALKYFQQNIDIKGIAHCVRKIETCATKLKWCPKDD
ncbi:MAG: tetratricopeptide repeat protein [Candidatus Hodarchaeota archaeon]